MCGRYGITARADSIRDYFGAELEIDYTPRYNVAPETEVPVIRNDRPQAVVAAEWGFRAPWNKKKPLINARSESAAEKQTFKEAYAERRCLILSTGFYEWQEQPRGPKQPYFIRRKDEKVFAYAGLWNPANGYEKPTCIILTTEPSDSIEHIHDRMPVMLEPGEEDDWLTEDDSDELRAITDPYPSAELEAFPISTKVNNPTYDQPDIIEPVDVGNQSGLDSYS